LLIIIIIIINKNSFYIIIFIQLLGRIGIIDDDVVEESNLHRQVIHDETKVGVSKAVSAQQAINKLEFNNIIYFYSKCYIF